MLNAITVTNFKGESLRMELSKPEDTGLLIYNITGIGATTANINTTEIATIDGSVFNSARAQSRNIVFTIALIEKDTVEESRHRSYRYFPVKKPLTLEFETDERTSVIDGYVESNDPTIFSKDEYTQISVICPDPYFRSKTPVDTVFTGVDALFEFPFSNNDDNVDMSEPEIPDISEEEEVESEESAEETDTDISEEEGSSDIAIDEDYVDSSIGSPAGERFEKKLEMGEIRNETVYTLNYNGDADVGIFITIQTSGIVKGLTIFNTETREQMKFDDNKISQVTGSVIKSGDIITISTVKRQKYARLQRGTKVYNILNCLIRGSDWIQLTQGANILAYLATEGLDDITFRVTNYELYEGI